MNEIQLPHNWIARDYQSPLWRYLRSSKQRKRAVFVCHRRGGKDLLAVNHIACSAFERVGAYWHVFPEFKQAKAAIWNGITSEGEPGNEGRKGTKFLDHIPKELIDRTYENEMRIKFVAPEGQTTGSNYYLVGSDNYNSLVGTNPVGVVMSEYSLQEPAAWHYLSPILAENGGWALFIYTFRGRNHGWWLAQQAKKNPDWFYAEHSAGSGPTATKKPDGSPVITDEEIEKLRKEGIPEAVIQSEYYNNPDAPLEGAYYEKEMQAVKAEGRICDILYEPKLPVYTAWDIGHDMTVVIFYQKYGQEVRIIDCYFKTEESLPHFIGVIKSKPYKVYEAHYGPWDIDTRQWSSGKSIMDVAKGLGLNFKVTPQKPGNLGRVDGIEQVKLLFPKLIFNGKNCEMLIEALRGYRSEPEPEKMQNTGEGAANMKLFKSEPLHSWESHFADALRILAWNDKSKPAVDWSKLQDKAVDSYTYV